MHRSKRRTITTFEHTQVSVSSTGLTELEFDALARFHDQSKSKFYKLGHRKIVTCNYVGILQVGDLTLEVLPKIDRPRPDEQGRWRGVLMTILSHCKLVPATILNTSSLQLSNHSLLEAFLRKFVGDVENLVQEGLRKKYVRTSSNERFCKGKILFSQNVCRNAGDGSKFFVNFDSYSIDHTLNQILVSALSLVAKMDTGAELKRDVNFLLVTLDLVQRKNFLDFDFERVTYDRGTRRYQPSIEIAELVIKSLSPDISTGPSRVLAFMFDMNKLFEEYIFRALASSARDFDGIARRQVSKKFWRSRVVKPDIVIALENKTIVLDTKWKVNDGDGSSITDLKQMFVYNHLLKAELSLLLFPKAGELESNHGSYNGFLTIDQMHKRHGCGMMFVNIFSADGTLLSLKELGRQIWSSLTPHTFLS